MPLFPSVRRLPRPLLLFLLTNALTTAVCLLIETVCRLKGFTPIYYKSWFVGVKFNDFLSFYPRFQTLHTAGFWDLSTPYQFAYPAPCLLVYDFFYQFQPRLMLPAFLVFSAGSFLAVGVGFRRALQALGLPASSAMIYAGSAGLMAFPFWFMLERGNIEIVVFLALAAGVWAYVRRRGYTAAACFALAASFKIVPVVYFALFLRRRQLHLFAVACFCTALFVLGSLWFAGPTISVASHGIAGGVALFTREILAEPKPDSIGFDHTLFSIYRRFYLDPATAPAVYRLYTPVVGVVGAMLYLVRIRLLPFANQLLCLSIAAIWLPPVSFEYTLLHLYLAVAILSLAVVAQTRKGGAGPDSTAAPVFLVLLAFLVSPCSEFIVHGARYAGQIQSLVLLVLFVLALSRPVKTIFDTATT